jgi:hypothetical protein
MPDSEWIPRRETERNEQQIWRELSRLGKIIEGPPHPGLEKSVSTFLAEFKAVEREREKQHKANQLRLNLIIGILGLIGSYCMIYVTFHHW